MQVNAAYTVFDRYIQATQSSNLTLKPNSQTDVDVLMAAGFVSSGNSQASLALRFFRMKFTGDTTPFNELSEIAGHWIAREGRGYRRMSKAKAYDIASKTLFWWLNPTCKTCNGIGHPLIPNSNTINYAHKCTSCAGSGLYPLHSIVPQGTSEAAHRLIDNLNDQCSIALTGMKRCLMQWDNAKTPPL